MYYECMSLDKNKNPHNIKPTQSAVNLTKWMNDSNNNSNIS